MRLSHEYREQWSTSSKVLFRLLFVYFSLYFFFFVAGSLLTPVLVKLGQAIGSEGRLERFPTGSGDTTMAYLQLLFLALIIPPLTIIWSILDRKRPSYNQFFYWFLVILRMFLILQMFIYGFAKIYKVQFPTTSLARLLMPIGEMSPMGLAWTYMGHSEGFNMFVGILEVLGGLLLIPRRTQTLGAFITIGVMTQVMMMNFFFDIPVKLFSAHLVAMALIIFMADWRRFSQVFIKNETATAIQYYEVSRDPHYKKLIFWFKVIVASILIGLMCWQGYSRERSFGDKREKPELYGIWEVSTFVKNADTLPPLLTDQNRWRYLIVDRKGSATIKFMTDKTIWYDFDIDKPNQTLSIYRKVDSTAVNNFKFARRDSTLHIDGIFYNDTLRVDFKAKDLSKIELLNRGFHWVNETPYNR